MSRWRCSAGRHGVRRRLGRDQFDGRRAEPLEPLVQPRAQLVDGRLVVLGRGRAAVVAVQRGLGRGGGRRAP